MTRKPEPASTMSSARAPLLGPERMPRVKIEEPDWPKASASEWPPTHQIMRPKASTSRASQVPKRAMSPNGPTRDMSLSLASYVSRWARTGLTARAMTREMDRRSREDVARGMTRVVKTLAAVRTTTTTPIANPRMRTGSLTGAWSVPPLQHPPAVPEEQRQGHDHQAEDH